MVFLKLLPSRQNSLARRPCDKLSARYYDTFEKLERVGDVAYHLLLSPGGKIIQCSMSLNLNWLEELPSIQLKYPLNCLSPWNS